MWDVQVYMVSTELGLRFHMSLVPQALSSKQLKYRNSQLMKMLKLELEDMDKVIMIFGFFEMREH